MVRSTREADFIAAIATAPMIFFVLFGQIHRKYIITSGVTHLPRGQIKMNRAAFTVTHNM